MSPAALEMTGITVRFGGILALNGVNLRLANGSVHALIGPNGAGKTTLVSVLSGERRPDEGSVSLNGQDISGLPALKRARLGLTRTYQLTALFQGLTLRENLLLALVARERPALSLADIMRRRDRAQHAAEVETFLARFALTDKAGEKASSLSHGDRRRLEIAMALASGPKVLLLDEPLAGLSTSDATALVQMIAGTIKGEIPILLIEHDMDAVFQLADEITVMVNGTVLASGTPDEIRTSPEVQAAYLSEEDDF